MTTVLCAPILLTPTDDEFTNDATPTFTRDAVTGATRYRLQVDDMDDFSSPRINTTRSGTAYTPSTGLPDGVWYWHVQALGGDGEWSAYGDPWSFTVDRTKPAKPVLLLPTHKSTVTTNLPVFDWTDAVDADHYEIQVDNSYYFRSPELAANDIVPSTYTATESLADGAYYWRVRAYDAAGNKSGWSSIWKFTVAYSGAPSVVEPPPTETPTPDAPTPDAPPDRWPSWKPRAAWSCQTAPGPSRTPPLRAADNT